MKKYALLGLNTQNSYSKIIHETLFNCEYDLINIKNSQELETWIRKQSKNYNGFNITNPYKIEIIKFLHSMNKKSKEFESVNCVKNTNGDLVGYNTDGNGFKMQLDKQNINILNKQIAILGTGGVSRAIVGVLSENNCHITLFGRSKDKLNWFSEKYPDIKTDNINKFADKKFDIIINSTPADIELPKVENIESVVIDLKYNSTQSEFLIKAEKLGYKTYNGLYMLVYQAILSQKIWRS